MPEQARGDNLKPEVPRGVIIVEQLKIVQMGIRSRKPVRLALAKIANYWLLWEATGLLMPKRGLDFFAPRVDDGFVQRSGRRAAETLRPLIKPNAIVLDLGCGMGRVAKYVAPSCKFLCAVDSSSAYCRRAKSYLKGMKNVRVMKVDGRSLQNFRDETFDFVYSWEVLVHAKKEVVAAYLREVWRVLKGGGKFYFHLPRPEITFPPFEWYTREELEDLLITSPLILNTRIEGKDEVTFVMSKQTYNEGFRVSCT